MRTGCGAWTYTCAATIVGIECRRKNAEWSWFPPARPLSISMERTATAQSIRTRTRPERRHRVSRGWIFKRAARNLMGPRFFRASNLVTRKTPGMAACTTPCADHQVRTRIRVERETGKPIFRSNTAGSPRQEQRSVASRTTAATVKKPPTFARQALRSHDHRAPRLPTPLCLDRSNRAQRRPFAPPRLRRARSSSLVRWRRRVGLRASIRIRPFLYVNSMRCMAYPRLVPRSRQARSGGRSLYLRKCAVSSRRPHAAAAFPSLSKSATSTKTVAAGSATLRARLRRMPGFSLPEQTVEAIARYVISGEDKAVPMPASRCRSLSL